MVRVIIIAAFIALSGCKGGGGSAQAKALTQQAPTMSPTLRSVPPPPRVVSAGWSEDKMVSVTASYESNSPLRSWIPQRRTWVTLFETDVLALMGDHLDMNFTVALTNALPHDVTPTCRLFIDTPQDDPQPVIGPNTGSRRIPGSRIPTGGTRGQSHDILTGWGTYVAPEDGEVFIRVDCQAYGDNSTSARIKVERQPYSSWFQVRLLR